MDGASSGSQEGPESQLLLGATHASLIFAKRSAGKIRPEPAGLQGWWGAGYAVGVRVVWHFFKNVCSQIHKLVNIMKAESSISTLWKWLPHSENVTE